VTSVSAKSAGKTTVPLLRLTRHTPMSAVLFVSHDRDLREVASRVLRKAGWEVTAVPHGGHAVLACVAGRTFDVLVVDDRTPQESGSSLARRLRRYCPAIRAVSLDGRTGCRDGDAITVVRPYTADDLIGAVLEAIATTALARA
jgi:CheY-like chemotaxis protein